MTIISNYSGNFGNHSMIHAITRVVADKNGYDFAINPRPEYDYFNGQSQFYFLNGFLTNYW